MKLRITLLLLILGSWITVQQGWADPITFNITQIDVPGSTTTRAIGINNVGQIVGSYTDSTGRHGFLDTNGTFTTLDFPGSTLTEATGINNAGQIVGFYSGGVFLYANGTFSNLNIPAFRSDFAVGNDLQVTINDAGHIAGVTSDGRGYLLYTNGQLTFLPPVPGNGDGQRVPLSINNADATAGFARDFNLTITSAFAYSNGQYTTYACCEAEAYGINNLGHIVVNDSNSSPRTYLIANGVVSYLPPIVPHETTFGGFGRGLNDSDQIVGSYLNGQGFLATPVPEPASVLLFASGLAGVGLLLQP